MTGRIHLERCLFGKKDKPPAELHGHIVVLPYEGQQVWDAGLGTASFAVRAGYLDAEETSLMESTIRSL